MKTEHKVVTTTGAPNDVWVGMAQCMFSQTTTRSSKPRVRLRACRRRWLRVSFIWGSTARKMSVATLKSRICTDTCGAPLRFEETKSDTLNLRVSPSFKLALKAAADNEQRSMVNMLEVLVANYCEQHQIVLPTMQQRRREASNSPVEGGK